MRFLFAVGCLANILITLVLCDVAAAQVHAPYGELHEPYGHAHGPHAPYIDEFADEGCCACGECGPICSLTRRGLGATLRTGIIFTPASSGPMDNLIRDGGWSIEGTFRQEIGVLSCPCGGPYLEIGGSYMHNYGIDQFITTSGTFVQFTPGVDPVRTPLQDFLQTRLNHLQRASFQVGLGTSWISPQFLNPSFNDKVLLSLRGGMRFGHVHARYDQAPTATLQNLIDNVPINSSFRLSDDVKDTERFFGLYVAGGLEIASIPVPLFPGWGEFRLVTEVTYEHSWFDLGAFGASDNGLGTAAALIGVTAAW